MYVEAQFGDKRYVKDIPPGGCFIEDDCGTKEL